MSGPLGKAEQSVSARAMVRGFSAKLKEITSGAVTHLVIFKNNQPAATLIEHFCYFARLGLLQ
ncbi:hypothetical protein [Pseudomonas protegens]|uniref:hypothetical protein n=1 Tax=Pseudomonas protegens TaxID=380021 RepID=UPI00223A6F96|nr:hypothetical protein [Pseudomonas protegens]